MNNISAAMTTIKHMEDFESLIREIMMLLPSHYYTERNRYKYGETVLFRTPESKYTVASLEINWRPKSPYNSEFNSFGNINQFKTGDISDENYRTFCRDLAHDTYITLDVTPAKYLELYKKYEETKKELSWS